MKLLTINSTRKERENFYIPHVVIIDGNFQAFLKHLKFLVRFWQITRFEAWDVNLNSSYPLSLCRLYKNTEKCQLNDVYMESNEKSREEALGRDGC